MEQRSEEWHAARLGKVTASRVADVMAKTKTGYGAARKNYMMELLCQRLTGVCEDNYQNAAMLRGVEMEPIARGYYEAKNGVLVEEVGFIDHPEIAGMGASPDGLVGADGLIEIKCPNTAQHVAFLQSGKIERKYQLQMLAQMACTGRAWCDFVSFDDRLPDGLSYAFARYEAKASELLEMISEVKAFLDELAELEKELKEIQG